MGSAWHVRDFVNDGHVTLLCGLVGDPQVDELLRGLVSDPCAYNIAKYLLNFPQDQALSLKTLFVVLHSPLSLKSIRRSIG